MCAAPESSVNDDDDIFQRIDWPVGGHKCTPVRAATVTQRKKLGVSQDSEGNLQAYAYILLLSQSKMN